MESRKSIETSGVAVDARPKAEFVIPVDDIASICHEANCTYRASIGQEIPFS